VDHQTTIWNLLRRLKGVTWTWSKVSAEKAIASLGARMIQRAPGRSTYETPERASLSLYSEGDQAEFVEITLEAFQDPQLLSEAEYEQKADEFLQKFRAAVEIGTRILGQPVFNDGVGRDGFPEDQDAVWLALWTSGNARLMIEQKHEDKELPMRLCIVIAPPV
jgi:hypothetical protein